ncbi:MAG: transglutaminase domain-containing protein [Microbacterium sp.]
MSAQSAPVAATRADAAVPVDPSPVLVARIVAGFVFLGAVVAIAALAAWPIYRDWSFLLLVGVAALVAAAIAALTWIRRWGGRQVAGLLVLAFFVLGVPLAVPSRLGGVAQLLPGLGEVATGALFGWKDLVTVDLPVGTYRNLLVPALIVFLVGTCAGLLLAWREGRAAYGAVPVALGMISFGLFFGRTTVSGAISLGPVTIAAPLETALGIAGLLSCLLWLAWRSRDERTRSLRRAAASSGVHVSRRPSGVDRRRTALGAGMIAVAVLAAAVVVPFAARGAEREVLRSAAGPEVAVSSAISPLAQYRSLFADDRADDVLFTVSSSGGALPDRVRLATLDSYDGVIYRSGGTGALEQARFVRVPSVLDAGSGRPLDARITIQDLDGIWMPTIGRIATVEFTGDRAASLADRFYYRAGAAAGVQTAGGGFAAGDAYRLTAVEPSVPDLAAIEAPGGLGDAVAIPQNLRTWVDEHVSGSGGAALAGLVVLLRERGYLSHALDIGDETPAWMQSLPDYTFQPSASGHSLARVDAMFGRLLERESDPRAAATENYVAAVGDDEQFAAAVALVAQELGFPSRVVVGARLSSTDSSLPACEYGVCRAQDLAAWTEVQSAAGEWVPIDVTPQFAQSPSLEVTEQRNPENVTEVRPDAVEDVVPPDPVQEDSGADRADDDGGLDLAWLWPILRVGGIVLLLLLLVAGPFVLIAAAKAARRRARRTQGAPAAQVAGGWDEYVDAAVDSGRDASPALTRSELAERFSTPAGESLAVDADRAVFSGAPVSADDAAAFWRTVEVERRRLARERGVWRGIVATVSLRSFVRHLAPSGSGSRPVERGRRRLTQPVRTSP